MQYLSTTEQVHCRLLLIVPPWINKFHILDLRPRNSFIKFAVDQGFTLFVASWANPRRSLGDKAFEDYLELGPLAALDAIELATGECEATVIGYCLGGTLTARMLAWMAGTGDERVKAATFFTSMTGFAEPGDLAVFIDGDWNADGTRMPHMMRSLHLRSMYQNNLLARPGGIELKGVPLDLGRITVPCYFLSPKDDHIAPWRSTYRGSLRFGGPIRYVLGGSGHIAGVINPPSSAKYGYWTGARRTGVLIAGLPKPTCTKAPGGPIEPVGCAARAGRWYRHECLAEVGCGHWNPLRDGTSRSGRWTEPAGLST